MIRVRRYRSSDRAACARILKAAMALPPWNERWPLARARQKIRDAEKHQTGFVAIEDGAPVAHLWATTYIAPQGTVLFVTNLQTDPAYHGKGAGTLLMRAAERHARGRKIPIIELFTNNQAPAYRFYLKRGYRLSPYKTVIRKRL